jgi:uncharacterized surface protein with fasciclin (FAS1) repeats
MQVINVFRNFLLLGFALAAVFLMAVACGSDVEEVEVKANSSPDIMTTSAPLPEAPVVSNTIVDIAVADGRFTTLVTALQAAELDTVLSGDDKFTVFAPTDDAFAKLPEGTLDSLLADIPGLKDVLLYHVTSGSVMAGDVVSLDSAATLQGQKVDISVMGDAVMVDEANVVITDIIASNGVIHVIIPCCFLIRKAHMISVEQWLSAVQQISFCLNQLKCSCSEAFSVYSYEII